MKRIRVSVVFGLLILVHLLLSAIDRFSQVALVMSVYLVVPTVLIRLLTGATRLGELFRWVNARKVLTTVWLLLTLSICVQALWAVSAGAINIWTFVTVMIFAALFLGMFLVTGNWIWEKAIGQFT